MSRDIMWFLPKLRNKLVVIFPFLKLTIPFDFQIDWPLETCIFLLKHKSVPKTLRRRLFSRYLEVKILKAEQNTAQLYIEQGIYRRYRRRFFVVGYLKVVDSKSTSVTGNVTSYLFFIPFFIFIALLQLLDVLFPPMFLPPWVVLFILANWAFILTAFVLHRRWEAHKLIAFIKDALFSGTM